MRPGRDFTGIAPSRYTPRPMDISFWPHIWAIPLTVLLGIGIGWYLRAQVEDDD